MAGIDVHKKVLMVVVVDTSTWEEKPERRRFATLPSELQRFRIWHVDASTIMQVGIRVARQGHAPGKLSGAATAVTFRKWTVEQVRGDQSADREKYPVRERTVMPACFGRTEIFRNVSSRIGFEG